MFDFIWPASTRHDIASFFYFIIIEGCKFITPAATQHLPSRAGKHILEPLPDSSLIGKRQVINSHYLPHPAIGQQSMQNMHIPVGNTVLPIGV